MVKDKDKLLVDSLEPSIKTARSGAARQSFRVWGFGCDQLIRERAEGETTLEGRDLLHFDERNVRRDVPPERNKLPTPRKKEDRNKEEKKERKGSFLGFPDRTNWVLLTARGYNFLPFHHFVSTQFLLFADAVPFINI